MGSGQGPGEDAAPARGAPRQGEWRNRAPFSPRTPSSFSSAVSSQKQPSGERSPGTAEQASRFGTSRLSVCPVQESWGRVRKRVEKRGPDTCVSPVTGLDSGQVGQLRAEDAQRRQTGFCSRRDAGHFLRQSHRKAVSGSQRADRRQRGPSRKVVSLSLPEDGGRQVSGYRRDSPADNTGQPAQPPTTLPRRSPPCGRWHWAARAQSCPHRGSPKLPAAMVAPSNLRPAPPPPGRLSPL